MNQKLSKADELFFVVDENNQPRESLPRKLVHGHGVWHRVSHVWVQNDKGQLLCQQRSLEKELLPGFWECFFGGHIRPNETYEDAAVRETREELGINISADDLRLWKVYKFSDGQGYNNEFMGDVKDLTFDDGEVAQAVWKDILGIKQVIHENGGESWTNVGYESQLLDELDG
jgi:isopentenyldiphosphate isomerase